MLKAIGEPTRAKLLCCLLKCGRACSVSEVAECCSIDFSMVARHLSTMARAGVLKSEKHGRQVFYEADGGSLAKQFRALADAFEDAAPSECSAGPGEEGDCCSGGVSMNNGRKQR